MDEQNTYSQYMSQGGDRSRGHGGPSSRGGGSRSGSRAGGSRAGGSGTRSVPTTSGHGYTSSSHGSTGQRDRARLRSPSPPPPSHQSPPHGSHRDVMMTEAAYSFYDSIKEILEEPGHHLLPHLHPQRPPNTLWFTDDSSVASAVTEIFERDFKDPHARWKDVTEPVLQRWFTTFARKYHWESGITGKVYGEFKGKVQQQLPDMVSRWKKLWLTKGNDGMPFWFNPNVWEGLVAFWSNPDHQKRSDNSKSARSKSKNSTHRSGRTSFVARGRMLAEERGESETDLLEVLAYTKRNPDGTFLDDDSEELYNDVNSKLKELTQNDDPESVGSAAPSLAMKNKVFVQSAPRKKGKIRGIGSLQSHVDTATGSVRCSSSSQFQSPPEVAQIKEELTQTKSKLACYEEMFGYLIEKDPNLREIMRRYYPDQQQVNDGAGGLDEDEPGGTSGPSDQF